jgi:hypothetical protein
MPAPIASAFGRKLWSTEAWSHYQWSVKPGAREAKLKIWKFQGHQDGCTWQKPHFSPEQNVFACQSASTVKIPLTELRGFGVPATAGDASAANRLERYLNGRTRLTLRNGNRAVGTKESPVWLESQGKFDPRYGLL